MKPAANHLEASLDLALELTFPASDPVAVCMDEAVSMDGHGAARDIQR